MKKAGIADPKPDFLKYVARLSNPQSYDAGASALWPHAVGVRHVRGLLRQRLARRRAAGRPRARCRTATCADVPDYFAELPEDKAPKGRVLVPTDAIPSMSDGGLVAVRTMSTKARQEGIPIRTGMRVTKMLQDKSGRVIGVEAKDELDATVRLRARRP